MQKFHDFLEFHFKVVFLPVLYFPHVLVQTQWENLIIQLMVSGLSLVPWSSRSPLSNATSYDASSLLVRVS